LSQRTSGASRSRRTALLPGSSHDPSAGVTVNATSSDAASDTMYAAPRGTSRRPSTPLRKNRGTNTSMMMRVA